MQTRAKSNSSPLGQILNRLACGRAVALRRRAASCATWVHARGAVTFMAALTLSACAKGSADEQSQSDQRATTASDDGAVEPSRDGAVEPSRVCGNDLWDHDADPSTPCVEMTICQAGQYVEQAGTGARDRQCAPCEAGSFSTQDNAAVCDPWRICGGGSRESRAGSASEDRMCETPNPCTEADAAGDENPCNDRGDTAASCHARDADSYLCTCSTGWRSNSGRCLPRNCATILAANPAAADGTYLLDPSTVVQEYAPLTARCDMTTDGGGWTLVLSYSHRGGTDPALRVLFGSLPQIGSEILGADESTKASWGHAGNALFAAVGGKELRFEARTSSHPRHLHFVSSDPGCIAYFRSGTGNCRGLPSNYRALPDHDAYLPAAIDSGFENQGDQAMTAFPFYRGATYHWGIGVMGRWEVDDYPAVASSQDTLHRIWTR